MNPVSKSDLMVQVEQLTIERDGWKDAALQAMAAEVLFTDAVNTHRQTPQVDGWGHYKPDADLKLWGVLDKIEAHNSPADGAVHGCGCAARRAGRERHGGSEDQTATRHDSRGLRAIPSGAGSYGGSN